MTTTRIRRWLAGGVGVALVLPWAVTASAQTFSSGSTGADGAFAPTATTTLALPPDGVFNFTTVNVPVGVTVTFTPNSANTPVTILATGDVTIAGTLGVNGANGAGLSTTGPLVNVGGVGGPGGFAGGNGGARGGTSAPSAGQGPGGGAAAATASASAGSYGAPASFVTLLPLFGGSGGGGGNGGSGGSFGSAAYAGGSGGGGGGALVVASSTRIVVSGAIQATGGGVVGTSANTCTEVGAPGSGGAIRLVAPQITGTGALQAAGGTAAICTGIAGSGRIRLEAFTLGFTGTSAPPAAVSAAPGPVTATSNPALVNLPTLRISTVGGVAAPANPSGSYTTADVSLPQGTTNPVPVTLTASSIPVGTIFTVKLILQAGDPTTGNSGPSTGTFSSSTATASVTFPSGQVSLLNASASFTLPALVAGLFPLIDGEPVERVMVAAAYGEPSRVTLITRSGKEIPAEQVLQGAR